MSKYSDTAYILENLLSCLISGTWYKCTVVFLDANNSNWKKEEPRPPGFSPTRIQISQIFNFRLVSIFIILLYPVYSSLWGFVLQNIGQI